MKKSEAEVVWLVYDLVFSQEELRYHLKLTKKVYTNFVDSLNKITHPRVGNIDHFINKLQETI